MGDYLQADCVFGHLFASKILTPAPNWKQTNPKTASYYRSFSHAGRRAILSFYITVVDGQHCIGLTALKNQAKTIGFDPDSILHDCIV
jgi:hypothetical protein